MNYVKHHRILLETGWAKPDFDVSMANNPTNTRFVVRLQLADFEQARQLEEAENNLLVTQAPPDHYLFGFTDDELFGILMKPDEWNSYDVSLAQHILRLRGRAISTDTVRLMRQHRVAEMAKPEPSQKTWIVAGYLFAVVGGILGIIIGWHLRFHQKILSDGTQVLAFSPRDRVHGFRILLLGIFGVSVSILLQALKT